MKNDIFRQSLNMDRLLTGLGTALLRSIRDPFSIMAADYRILWLNKSMAFIHGGSHEDAVGKVCFEFFSQRQAPCENCPLEHVFATGRSKITEQYLDFPNGERRWGEVKAYPVRGENHDIVAAFVIVFDITERKRMAEAQKEYASYLSKQLDAASGTGQTFYLDDGDIAFKTSLSPREKDVLRLLTEGDTNTQISDRLAISPHTVKSHVISIFNKLGVSDRTQAAVLAIRYNLI